MSERTTSSLEHPVSYPSHLQNALLEACGERNPKLARQKILDKLVENGQHFKTKTGLELDSDTLRRVMINPASMLKIEGLPEAIHQVLRDLDYDTTTLDGIMEGQYRRSRITPPQGEWYMQVDKGEAKIYSQKLRELNKEAMQKADAEGANPLKTLSVRRAESFLVYMLSHAVGEERGICSLKYKNGDAFEPEQFLNMVILHPERLFMVDGLTDYLHKALGQYCDVTVLEDMAESIEANAKKAVGAKQGFVARCATSDPTKELARQ